MHGDAEDQRGGTVRSVEVGKGPEWEDLPRGHVAEGVAGECHGTGGEGGAAVVTPGDAGRADAGTNGRDPVVLRDPQTSAGLEEVSRQDGAVEEARDGPGVSRGGGPRRRSDDDGRGEYPGDAADRDSQRLLHGLPFHLPPE